MNEKTFAAFRHHTEKEIRLLKRKNNILLALIAGGMAVAGIMGFTRNNTDSEFDTVRVKKLVVEDDRGTERIVLSPQLVMPGKAGHTCGIWLLDAQGKARLTMDMDSLLVATVKYYDPKKKSATVLFNSK